MFTICVIYLFIYFLTDLLTCLFIYLHTYLLTYLLAYGLTYLLTYLLTPCSRVLLEKLTSFQLVKKFPAFHRNRKFITACTSARHLSLTWASSILSMPPRPTSWWSKFIFSSHLRLCLPSGLSMRLLYKTYFLTESWTFLRFINWYIASLYFHNSVLHVMLFRMLNMFCTFTSALPAVCVQCPIWLYLFMQFLNFVLSRHAVQLLYEWFWDGSSSYWYQFSCYIPQALNFYCKEFMFKIFSAYFFNTFLFPDISLAIDRHVPFALPRIMISSLLLGMVLSVCTCWYHITFT